MTKNQRTTLAKLAFRFVLTIGIVNLFADLTYEGDAAAPVSLAFPVCLYLHCRYGAIEELTYLLHEDRERAVALFERLMDGQPELLQAYPTQEFLRIWLV